MNGLDYLIILFLGYFAVRGMQRGIVRIVFDLVGLIGGVLLSIRYYPYFVTYFQKTFSLSQHVAIGISVVFILMAMISISIILGRLLDQIVTMTGLGLFNRLLGGGLGVVKGFFLLIPFLMSISVFRFNLLKKSTLVSYSIPYFYDFAKQSEILNQQPYIQSHLDQKITALVEKI